MLLEVSVQSIVNSKPGDPCPDEDCKGYFQEITIKWDKTYFGATAYCPACKDTWQLVEEHTPVEEENAEG